MEGRVLTGNMTLIRESYKSMINSLGPILIPMINMEVPELQHYKDGVYTGCHGGGES